jgi:hypothetical protein
LLLAIVVLYCADSDDIDNHQKGQQNALQEIDGLGGANDETEDRK